MIASAMLGALRRFAPLCCAGLTVTTFTKPAEAQTGADIQKLTPQMEEYLEELVHDNNLFASHKYDLTSLLAPAYEKRWF